MLPAPIFHPVGPSQADELLNAVRRYYAEDGISFDASLVEPALDQLLADPTLGRAYFLNDEAGNRAGYVVFSLGFDHEMGGRLATVTDLFIEPGHRRRGLARAALDFVVGVCRELGVRALELQPELTIPPGRHFTKHTGLEFWTGCRCTCNSELIDEWIE